LDDIEGVLAHGIMAEWAITVVIPEDMLGMNGLRVSAMYYKLFEVPRIGMRYSWGLITRVAASAATDIAGLCT
jgi:hypothetical protein